MTEIQMANNAVILQGNKISYKTNASEVRKTDFPFSSTDIKLKRGYDVCIMARQQA